MNYKTRKQAIHDMISGLKRLYAYDDIELCEALDRLGERIEEQTIIPIE